MLEICVLCLNLNPSQFRFHRRMQSYTELASVHGHVKAQFPTISGVQSSFLPGRKLFGDGAWAHFLNVGQQSSQGHILDSFATSFLHAAGISKLESVVCGGRLEDMVKFKLSCLIRNDVRCMLFVTCLFSCSFGILKLGIFFRKCRLSHLSLRFYYIETGMTIIDD